MKTISAFRLPLTLATVMVLGLTPVPHALAQTADVKPMKDAPASFADLAERLLPAVVNISSTQKVETDTTMPPDFPEFPEGSPFKDFFEEFMDRRAPGMPVIPPTSLGSGFVIDGEKGIIITNNHVIKDAEEVRVTFHDDTTVPAEILGSDEKTDIAVLRVKTNKKLTAVSLGDSQKMRVGDWVLAIGNPFGLGGTVTAGIISARQRNINAGPYDDFIQTDASINRGNSGGPMFNLKGEVIGINTAIFSPSGGSVGIGFAIPSSLAQPVIDQLVKYGKTRRGWLGVKIQTVTDEIAQSLGLKKTSGAMVAAITPQGPAADAKLQPGDVILSFNGHDIHEMRELPRVVAETEIDSKVPLEYWRNGKLNKVTVTVGQLEKAEEDGLLDAEVATAPASDVNVPVAGISVATTEGGNDIVITTVKTGTVAADAGLMPGDVILEINRVTPKSPKDAARLFDEAARGKTPVLLLIDPQGSGDTRFVGLKLNEAKVGPLIKKQ
ncbi:MAG: DegQ family serine endoprotease [Pseudobdellovibrionaceae bacterium]